MRTRPRLGARGISTEQDFLTRIGFESIEARFRRSGKGTIKLYGADVLEWGHRNDELTTVLGDVVKEGWGGHYMGHTDLMPELKRAFAGFEKEVRGVDCGPEDIIPVSGIAAGWHLLHSALLDPGDEIVCVQPAHYFWNPVTHLRVLGAKAVGANAIEDKDWEPDVEDLRRKITRRTKAVVVVHPNNPTGAVYSEKSLREIIDIAGEHELAVVSDEIYDLITFDDVGARSVAAVAGDVPVITTYSTSKFFMKPGWRVGYLHIHDPSERMEESTDALKALGSTYGYGQNTIPTFMAAAAARAFRGRGFGPQRSFLRKLQESRDATYRWLNRIEGVSCRKPAGSMYAFPRVESAGKSWGTIEHFLAELAREEGIAFVPGSHFGAQGEEHFRTLLLPDIETLDEVYSRLEHFMKKRSDGRMEKQLPRAGSH